jgi:YkoY family integral membrane protein
MLLILSAIVSVTILEIMLSIDNALINASLAKKLPQHLQKKAVYFGISLGALFRVISLLLATLIISNPYIKTASALYLFWLAYEHLYLNKKDSWHSHPVRSVRSIFIQIALANLVFSIDNIIGVVGVSHSPYAIMTGVLLGVVALLFITPFVLRLMHTFPSLEKTTYILLIYIGVITLLDVFFQVDMPEYITFLFIVLAMFFAMQYDKRRS